MKLFGRLFLLLAGFSIIPIVAIAVLLWVKSHQLNRGLRAQNLAVGSRVSAQGVKIFEDSVRATHLKIVQEKARKVEEFFASIRRMVEMESAMAGKLLASATASEDVKLYTAKEVADLKDANGDFANSALGIEPYTMFHLPADVPMDAVRGTLSRLREMGVLFSQTQRTFRECRTSYVATNEGLIVGYPGGQRFASVFDPRTRPWYIGAVQRQGTTWTDVYVNKDGHELVVTCSTPIWPEGGGAPLAVAAMDVTLDDILTELFAVGDLKVSAAALMDNLGKVRVSAAYKGATVSLLGTGSSASAANELVFSAVAKKVAGGNDDSGVLWDRNEKGFGGNLFVYSVVRFGGSAKPHGGDAAGGVAPKRWYYVVQLPLEPITRPVREMRQEIDAATVEISAAIDAGVRRVGIGLAMVMIAAMALAILIARRAARSAANPLVKMAVVAKAIGAGDLNQNVVVRSKDEIGDLGRAINDMVNGLKLGNFLKNYVPASLVNRIDREKMASVGGERRELTVFFSDLQGFTEIAETLDAESLVELLNEYLGAMTHTIHATEGTLDKYIGDAVLAFWGDSEKHDDDTVRACRTAMAQRQKLEELCENWAKRNLPQLKMRIGIQTGDVIVGNVGSTERMNYTVLGDVVNQASRFESANKFYGTQIMIGETTRLKAGDSIEVRELDLLAVKGKKEAVRVYELLGMRGEVPPERLTGYRLYESALAKFRERQWDETEELLNKAIAVLGSDSASQSLLNQVSAFRKTPPPPGWDGRRALHDK